MARVKRAQKQAHTFVRSRRFLTAAIFAFVVVGAIGAASGLAGPGGGGTSTINGDSTCGYSGGFTESTVMRWAQVSGSGLTGANQAKFIAFANDENSMLLGVNSASPNTASPDAKHDANGGDPSQTDASGRQYFPGLYITKLNNVTAASGGGVTIGSTTWTKPGDAIPQEPGDFQGVGTPRNISGLVLGNSGLTSGTPYVTDIFGTWVVGTQTTSGSPPPGNVGSLGSTLSTAANITSLPVGGGGLTKAVAVNDVITLTVTNPNHSQNWTVTAVGNVGDTHVTVKSQKPNFAYLSGTVLNDTTAHVGDYARQATLPAKNNWNLGSGNAQTGSPDTPSITNGFSALGDEGYGTEYRWNASGLSAYDPSNQTYGGLETGAWYKVQVIEHDGDQNKTGGDSGEFCTLIQVPGPPNVTTHPVSPSGNAAISEPLGSTINDSAAVSPNVGFPNPTGKITFKLFFRPLGDSTALDQVCTDAFKVYTSPAISLTVSGTPGNDSTASTAPNNGYATTGHGLGTYVWQAFYDPNGDPNYSAGNEDCGVETDTMVTARIKLGPHDATNSVGTAHTVTATLETTTDNITYTAVSGATINFTISGSLSGTGPNTHLTYDSGGSSSCSTAADGTCTTTINDNESEQITIHASATGFTQSGGGVQGSFGTFSTSTAGPSCTTDNGMDSGASTCDALKTYAIGRILISPETASNVVGTDHVLTATLQYSTDNGTTWTNAGTGATINFSIDAGSQAGAHFSNLLSTASCSTTAGSCSVTLQDTSAGTVNVNASSTFGVTGITGTFTVSTVGSGGTCSTSASGTAGNGNCDAVKHFIDGRILLSPESASNVVGNAHTFTATLQTTGDGSTWTTLAQSNDTVNWTLTPAGSAFFTDNSATTDTCTTAAGQCQQTINDNTPETVGVHVAASFQVSGVTGTFNVQTTNVAANCNVNAGSTNNGTCDAVKHFVTARILLTPETATNLVGNPHTFTATLQTSGDGTTWTTVSQSGDTIHWTATGLNTPDSVFFTDTSPHAGVDTCTTTSGGCSQEINDTKPDTVTVSVAASFTITGISGTFSVTTTPVSGGTCDPNASAAGNGTCNAIKTYFSPSTTLHVSDTLEGLPPDATGNVTYEVYTNLAQCQATPDSSTDRILNENDPIVTTGVIPTSSVVDVPKGTTIWWKVTYSGNDGTFTTDCTTETASSS
jgi:hypothetical protein